MFNFFDKDVPKEEVVFTENHSVVIDEEYVGSISIGKDGRFIFAVSPHGAKYWILTEDRLEKILAKVKELNADVSVSR